jgi:translation initiation factor IF-3
MQSVGLGQGAEPALERRAGWIGPLRSRHIRAAVAVNRTKEFRISDPRTNDRIRVPEVRLVGPAGEQVGVVRIEVALRLAQEADLDLVEVAPNSKPPVVKIMDYGKFKYEAAQKAKEARRNQANTVLKEVRFRLKIEAHDYITKLKRAEGFLQAGDKVKAMILFRGREQSRPEQGVRLLRKFAEDVAEFGTVESNPTIDGRNMVMVVAPHKNKSDVKTEQNAQRAANKEAARAARVGTGAHADAEDTAPADTAPAETAPPAPARAETVQAPAAPAEPAKAPAPAEPANAPAPAAPAKAPAPAAPAKAPAPAAPAKAPGPGKGAGPAKVAATRSAPAPAE